MNIDACFEKIAFESKPKLGWIKTIRESLSMPLSFPAKKMGISIQSVARFEKNEVDESITLKSLRQLAEAIDCELQYIIIPKQGSLQKMIEKRAYEKASELALEVEKTMILEDQKITNTEISVKLLAEEFAENFGKRLWNDDRVNGAIKFPKKR